MIITKKLLADIEREAKRQLKGKEKTIEVGSRSDPDNPSDPTEFNCLLWDDDVDDLDDVILLSELIECLDSLTVTEPDIAGDIIVLDLYCSWVSRDERCERVNLDAAIKADGSFKVYDPYTGNAIG